MRKSISILAAVAALAAVAPAAHAAHKGTPYKGSEQVHRRSGQDTARDRALLAQGTAPDQARRRGDAEGADGVGGQGRGAHVDRAAEGRLTSAMRTPG